MPEPVRDRSTRSHEYVFLLSKSRCYYYDADVIAEPAVSDHPSAKRFHGRHQRTHGHRGTSTFWNDVGGRQLKSDLTTAAHYAAFPSNSSGFAFSLARGLTIWSWILSPAQARSARFASG
jgi:hypothetical protein